MDIKEKAILQKHHTFLLNDLNLDDIRGYLYENRILTSADMEILAMKNSTRSQKNETFLVHILPTRGPYAFKEFLNALQEDSPHIVEALENTQVSEEDLQKARYTARQDMHQDVQTDGAVSLSEVSDKRRLIEQAAARIHDTLQSESAPASEAKLEQNETDESYYDFALFHANESIGDACYLKEFLEERLKDDNGHVPRIWHIDCDPESYEKTLINNIEYALKHSRYYFLYIDSNFARDNWGEFQKEQCLWKRFQNCSQKFVVPVLTDTNLKTPFGITTYYPIKLWKITNGQTMISFIESGQNISSEGQRYLKHMRDWFVKKVLPKRGSSSLSVQVAESLESLSLENPSV